MGDGRFAAQTRREKLLNQHYQKSGHTPLFIIHREKTLRIIGHRIIQSWMISFSNFTHIRHIYSLQYMKHNNSAPYETYQLSTPEYRRKTERDAA